MKSAMGSDYGCAFTGAGSTGYEDGILANGFDYFGGYYYAVSSPNGLCFAYTSPSGGLY